MLINRDIVCLPKWQCCMILPIGIGEKTGLRVLSFISGWSQTPQSLQKENCQHTSRALGFPGGTSGKEPSCQCRRYKRLGFNPWIGKIPWKRAWQPTPVFLPGESHGQRRLAGCGPQGRKEWTWLKQLSMQACIKSFNSACRLYTCIKER